MYNEYKVYKNRPFYIIIIQICKFLKWFLKIFSESGAFFINFSKIAAKYGKKTKRTSKYTSELKGGGL